MTQPYLYMRTKGSSPSQYAVFKEINMQLVQVGTEFGTNEIANVNTQYNRVANWGNDLFAIGQAEIWKYDVAAGGPWTSFHTYASHNISAGADYTKVGFTAASIDGSGVLVMGYPDASTANVLRFVYIDRDQNVREGNTISLSPVIFNGTAQIIGTVARRNNIIFRVHSGNTNLIVSYDASSETHIQAPIGISSMKHNQICISNDNIYTVDCVTSANPTLRKLVGSSIPTQGVLTTSIFSGGTANNYWGSALCEVDDKLFAFMPDDGGAGFYCSQVEFDSAGQVSEIVDVTSIVLPASLSSLVTTVSTHAMIRVDNTTNSGILPIYELIVYDGSTEGISPTLYRWNNAPSGQMALIDGGMDVYQYNIINATDGTAGEKVWSGSGVINASSPVLTINGSNINAEFVVYGANQAGISLEIIYDKEGETTSAIGTISSTTVGSIVDNKVTGLMADGITKVTVGWSAAADGIVSGDNPKVAARVFFP